MTDLSTYFQNGVTPIEASIFNAFGGEIQGVLADTVAARNDAQAAAEAASAPADDQIASLVANPSSESRSQLDWLYRRGRPFNVLDYGATGDGTTDDLAAVNSAMSAASAAGGGAVVFPAGLYRISAPLAVPAAVTLIGAAQGSAGIVIGFPTGDAITLGALGRVEELTISVAPGVTRTSGAHVSIDGGQGTVARCSFSGYYIGIQCGTASVMCNLPRLFDLQFAGTSTLAGSTGIFLRYIADARIDQVTMTGPGTGTQPDSAIRIGAGDTWFISNVNVVAHGVGLLIDTASGENTYAGQVVNGMFDGSGPTASGQASGMYVHPSGGVHDLAFANCYFGHSATQAGAYMTPDTGGSIQGAHFTGCQFLKNGYSGLTVSGANVKDWSVVGGVVAGNTNYGIDVSGATTNFVISNVRIGNVGVHGANNIGINLAAAAQTGYVIANNIIRGNTSAAIADSTTGTPSRINTPNLTA